ncbi:16S rRNA (cytosine(1402)-N(4))-methyltransferase RsmH [Chitinibacter bivalviorum]|uniref:Ribosomal RNA small subunit methyltransferase H n=1 Tax=Chitinibacter bivalviorum TaxID=2739434 RepID=A0A7H9BLX3_9NEIS|nr:16S rRNA (cytosine(1402)-N(4))-methyltransferase RsmH [Chitinibacter bivalviorum]QLG89432.1 16S rRNA (cytosine(1402)-N(4))-methyltransferase RsmH [Chitinibacter bivalviorum]
MSDTQSFVHRTVLLDEAVDGLAIKPDGIYVDCTFGRGGHSRLILSKLGPNGRLISFDKDPYAIAEAATITDPRFTIVHEGFVTLADSLAKLGVTQIDGLLMDLGVSSPQLDDGSRGFSFRFDAPLDMRMDTTRGITAAEWLNSADEKEIAEVVKDYGEERFARQVAAAIVTRRAVEPFATTGELAAVVATAVRTREPGQDPATRTFQAVRIYINRELEELSLTLPQALSLLKQGGRLSVIAFHSLEDRIVKRFMQDKATGDRLPSRLPVMASEIAAAPLKIVGKPIRASEVEVKANPRARSAILRLAERTEGPL